MHSFDIELKNISKIEGHTDLEIKVKNNKVKNCKLKIRENKRFFSQAIQGKPYTIVPSTMSRICGTCSTAHLFSATEAVEKALKLQVTEQTKILRNLLMDSNHLRDHALQHYFVCLPDIYEKDSVLEFEGELHELVHDGLKVKEAGNYISTIIGGRAIHPPNAVIGGFTKIPSKEELEEAKNKLIAIRPKILKLIEIFYNDKTTFKRESNYVGLINPDYNFLEGQIKSASGSLIPEEKFAEHLQNVVLPYSTATGFKWEDKDYMVGALARINLNKENLHPNTKKDAGKFLDIFPNNCIFNNNTAQAIECLHIIDKSLDKLNTEFKPEQPVKAEPKEKSTGIGVVEAPRGTLYYQIELDEKGNVTNCSLAIPTQQNIIHLEKDIASYVELLLQNKSITKEKISLQVEKMIRAYDPCMSCATHFLRINWI
jgi:coenzyme F420-reducing hydrogenase alpha subunit